VEVPAYIGALEREGTRLSNVAAEIDPTASIPTCPGWTLRDLLLHLGGIHRWAGSHLRDSLPTILKTDLIDIFDRLPDDAQLIDWYRCELDLLLTTLRDSPANVDCATFLPSISPLHHWARRQAHETCIHRADVESIRGELTPVDRGFALDGIDELVAGFVPRRFMKLRSETPLSLMIAPDDSSRGWVLTITDQPVVVTDDAVECDCRVGGDAGDIYFALWNRAPRERLTVTGDSTVLDLFHRRIQIRWA
jgi:uncharacterized protein (TIGR03083 family)